MTSVLPPQCVSLVTPFAKKLKSYIQWLTIVNLRQLGALNPQSWILLLFDFMYYNIETTPNPSAAFNRASVADAE